ncbi:CPBP family intramembrane glutamic endopeptidase [Chryseobacterium mulctrae]|uniref:CPBP family intramembrane glutamic endopeptidase n=1 Tax=Chryseobacterium mulctrae TaxID=2576777 RepID=UPI001115FC49|nr:CPBP family intramembrane glutamic endopeptidase [Chryseobacterium mulctrae]
MSLFTPLIWILIVLPFIALALFRSEKVNLKYLFFFILYFLADCYIQHLSKLYFDLGFLGLKFAWIGKILSICLSLIVIFSVSKSDRVAIGFTTKTNSKSQLKSGVLIFIGFLIFDFIFKMILFPKGGNFDLETFVFQMTMPGITEELVFRGILFWLLDKTFAPNWNFKGVKFGWGFVIITILFAVAHGVVLTENHEFKFDLITIVYLTLISSLSVGILRKLSGNLIFSILGHNAINTMNAVIRIL